MLLYIKSRGIKTFTQQFQNLIIYLYIMKL